MTGMLKSCGIICLVVYLFSVCLVTADYEQELNNLKSAHKRSGGNAENLVNELGSTAKRAPQEVDEKSVPTGDYGFDEDTEAMIRHFVSGLMYKIKNKMRASVNTDPEKFKVALMSPRPDESTENGKNAIQMPEDKVEKEVNQDEPKIENKNTGYDMKAMNMIWDLVKGVKESINRRKENANLDKEESRIQPGLVGFDPIRGELPVLGGDDNTDDNAEKQGERHRPPRIQSHSNKDKDVQTGEDPASREQNPAGASIQNIQQSAGNGQ